MGSLRRGVPAAGARASGRRLHAAAPTAASSTGCSRRVASGAVEALLGGGFSEMAVAVDARAGPLSLSQLRRAGPGIRGQSSSRVSVVERALRPRPGAGARAARGLPRDVLHHDQQPGCAGVTRTRSASRRHRRASTEAEVHFRRMREPSTSSSGTRCSARWAAPGPRRRRCRRRQRLGLGDAPSASAASAADVHDRSAATWARPPAQAAMRLFRRRTLGIYAQLLARTSRARPRPRCRTPATSIRWASR